MSGLFITFEGIEGSGKSTQARMLVDALDRQGVGAMLVREPGGTPVAEAVREILLRPGTGIAARAEALLFLAARAQNTVERIRPGLAQGLVVVCDRYSDSTMAYQGHARGLDLDSLRALDAFATGGLAPDVTFLLDLDVEVGLQRQSQRNRMEDEPRAFHERVRSAYLEEAAGDRSRIRLLDGVRPAEELHQEITRAVASLLGTSRRT
jgi:dTMP kinase